MQDTLLLLLGDAFWSAIAALGFAILFNVPRRTLLACAVCGALGHASRTGLMEMGMLIAPATLLGATLVGFLGNMLARRYRMPAVVFTVSGAIPMVPGVFAFRTMISVLRVSTATDNQGIQDALMRASSNGIVTGLVLAALAVGIAAPTLLFERHRPVV